jgi:putative NADH-flavin reductase
MMNLTVFGANGATGQLVTKQALAAGQMVTAVTRHPETFPLHHEHLQVLHGDVFDLTAVERAVAGQDAVISTLGVPFSRKPITIYSQGIAHIVEAMNQYGARRLVCVSSSATDPQTRYHDTGGGFVFEKILKPLIINSFGRTTYADMQRMEALVKNSRLDWIIVRPSGLFETEGITDYQMVEDSIRGQFTSRADLAACMLEQLTSDQFLHKSVAVATFSTRPKLLRFFVGEAFQRKPAAVESIGLQADWNTTTSLPEREGRNVWQA